MATDLQSQQIKDAELIYSGQGLTIDSALSAAEGDASTPHTKTGDDWSLGVVEESDKQYPGWKFRQNRYICQASPTSRTVLPGYVAKM